MARKAIAASAQVQESARLNVFLSYSRQDLAFVDRLQRELVARGIEASVDREQIEKVRCDFKDIKGR